MDFRNALIALLVVGCVVLGYFVWESQKPGIEIRAPGVDIRAK